MTRDELIKQCVDRFLAWRLPDTINPDLCTLKSSGFREQFPNIMSGTCLLTADEAKQMFEHVLEEVPLGSEGKDDAKK